MALLPKESGKLIHDLATHVKILEKGICELGQKIVEEKLNGKISINNFSQNEIHPKSSGPRPLDWLFVVDTLNFCFWHLEHKEGWKVEGYTGYFALCAAVNRALKEKIDILNPTFYATISEDQLGEILRSDTSVQIPLLKERVTCLQQSGVVLTEKFGGTFLNCVKQADGSAVKLVKLIIENFKSFRDECEYKGHKVSLYKRAQILVADIWSCYHGKGFGSFNDIDELTMFADYRVPQVLLLFGVFGYSDELMNKLKQNYLLENGSEMEVEIRGCSIHAVELLRDYAASRLPKHETINSIMIDHFLWDFRRQHAKRILSKGIPFHKCHCIYY